MLSAVAQWRYLDVAALARPSAVWNLEIRVEPHLQVVPLMSNNPPGTLHIGWEILGIVWRLDSSHVSMDHPSTAWPGKEVHING